MNKEMKIRKRDVWKAIWLDDNRPSGVAADFLRTLFPAQTSPKSTKGKRKVAIVVGHNERKTGAIGKMRLPEFHFNSIVAQRMLDLAESDPDIEIKVFFRKPFRSYTAEITDVYRRVNSYDPEVCLELHYNWLAGAGRIEMLHYPGSALGIQLSEILLEETGKHFEGEKKLVARSRSERGGLSISLCGSPCVLTEPFDSSSYIHASKAKKLGEEGIARIYFNALELFFILN